jgi:sugar phosphate isomerase/epimerase
MASTISDLAKLAIHTMTTKPWDLATAVGKYAASGVPGITVWRQWLEGLDHAEAGRMIREAGLGVAAHCRGGFYPALDAKGRAAAIDDNRRALDEAAAIGAPQLVLVCGAVPGQSLEENRRQIAAGIAACIDHAKAVGVKLSIEPLHPMYAGDRSAVNTVAQANDIIDQVGEDWVGIAADVYHIWWDPDLEKEIARAGKRILGFHVCDWLCPTTDLLLDRGLMGEGCIAIRTIRAWVEAAGFDGWNEVEIFSNRWWATDQDDYLEKIKAAYLTHV